MRYAHKPKKSKYLQNLTSHVKYSSPLKRSLSGYEIEMTLVDGAGDVSNDADKIIEDCKKIDPKFPVCQEVGHNMIEIIALPHSKVQKTALFLIDNVRQVMDVCEKHGLKLLPLGTYPGSFERMPRTNNRYGYSANALGREEYDFCCTQVFGFHYHYSLPRGVFDHKKKFLNEHHYSKLNTTMLDSYNFLIAADSAIDALAQSSPFVAGKYLAKDSRILLFRGGKKLKFEGLFNKLQMLGGLPPYKHTLMDLISTLNKKDAKFKTMLRKSGAPESFIKKKNKLDYIWNPVKINKIGTLEHRSMDTNYLDVNLGLSVMMKFILRAIQQEFYNVVPSDIGIEEPFKLEGNAIFIPPHTYVRNTLQYNSSYFGLEDDATYKSCSRFYNLAKKLIYKEYLPVLKPIKKILDDKKTVSDRIRDYARKKGCTDMVTDEVSRKIALLHSKNMVKGIDSVKKAFEKLDD